MKAVRAERLLSEASKAISDIKTETRRNLLFRVPITDVLCGLCLESSRFNASTFVPTLFVQPLYEYSTCVDLTIGKRFDGKWDIDDLNVSIQLAKRVLSIGLPYWHEYGSPTKLSLLPHDGRNSLRNVTKAYSLVMSREFGRAKLELESTRQEFSQQYRDQLSQKEFWGHRTLSDLSEVIEALALGPDRAVAILKSRARATAKALEVEEFMTE